MQSAPQHPEETRRLAELYALGLLDTAPDEAFDRVTRLAQTLCDVPMALVSLIDTDRQWFKSAQGLDVPETHRDIAFCAHAILADEMMVVEDAHADPRFVDNPLVTGGPTIDFYAGVPLLAEGLPVGTLCVLDTEARSLDEKQREGLRDLASLVESVLALRQMAVSDPLTGLQNLRGFMLAAAGILRVADREKRPVTVAYLDINNFKSVNDTLGHHVGDEVLKELAQVLRSCFRDADAIARIGGDEFAVLMFGTDATDIPTPLARLRLDLEESHAATDGPHQWSVSIGCATRAPGGGSIDELLALADQAMFRDKGEASARPGG